MFSSTRKCWPSCFFGRTLTAAGRRPLRWRRCGAASSLASSPRASASAAIVWTTCAGSFGRPRTRLRREVRAVRLGEDPVGGDGRGGLAQRLGLRIRRVAGEGEVPASLETGREQLRLREAVHDDGAVVGAEHRLRVVVRGAGVDDDRQAELGGERELRREEACAARPSRRRRSGSRARPRRRRRLSDARATARSSSDTCGLAGCGLMRVDPERRVDAVVSGQVERARGTSRSRCRS